MAGQPVGTMYVELSLDATKYTKAQKEILAGAEKNSADINKVFKTVGTQSDQMYDAMRKNIQNSLNAIKQSHLSSADEIRRAQESAAAKIKDINEKQYGHQVGIIEKLKANWIAAAAAIGAAMVIASKAYSMAKLGAELEETRGILNNMARQYKMTADDIVAAMARASKGLIANSDLMQVALGGLSKGLNPEQLLNLAKAADTLGDSIGVTATQALVDLTQALESGRVKGLKNFAGSTIDLKDAFGELASKMTAAEKTQAMYALIMIHTTELQKKQTEAVNDAADKFESMEAKYKNYSDTFSVVIMKMTVRLGDYGIAIGKAAQKTAQFFGLGPKMGETGPGVYEVPPIETDSMAGYKKIIADLKKSLALKDGADKGAKAAEAEREAALKRMVEATRKATYEMESVGKSQYEKDIDRIKSEAAEYLRITKNKVAVAKYVAVETELALRKSFIVQTEQNKKIFEEMQKGSEEYRKMVSDEQSFSVDKHEAAMLKIIAQENNKLLAAEKMMDEGKISWDEYQKYLVLVQKNTATATAELLEKELSDKLDLQLKYLKDMGQEYTKQYRELEIQKIKNEADRLEREFANAQGGLSEGQVLQIEVERKYTDLLLKEYEERLRAYADYLAGTGDKVGANKAIAAANNMAQKRMELNDRVVKNELKGMQTIFDKQAWIAKKTGELDDNLFQKKTQQIADGFGQLSSVFSQISALYDDGSSAANRWKEASNAMLIAQKAVAVVQAVAAIATQGLGDPYTAFARIAAMAAAMGALLATIGASVNSSSSGASDTPKTGDTNVLGGSYQQASESMANSLEKVEGALDNIFNVEDIKLTKIYNELKQLNNNIVGLVSSIFRAGGMEGSQWSIPSDVTAPMETGSSYFTFSSGLQALNEKSGGIANIITSGYLATTLVVTKLIDKAVGWIVGGSEESELVQSGIALGKTTIGSLVDGFIISAQQYGLVKTTKEGALGGLLGGDEESWSRQYSELDATTKKMLTLVYKNIGDTLQLVVSSLGGSIDDVKNYAFKSKELNLQGKTGEEVTKILTDYFSEIADKATASLLKNLIDKYQQVNEGAYETAIRLMVDKESVLNILAATGHGIEEISTSITKTREVVSAEWTKWEAERVIWSKSLGGWFSSLLGGSYKVPEPDKYVTQTYNEITSNAQAIIALSESLIELAGGLDKLTESAETYYNAFYSEAEKTDMLKNQLMGAFTELDLAFPATRSGFRDIVESLDLTTEAGQKTYVAMLNMAEAADQYYSYIDEIVDSLKSAREDMQLEGLQADIDRSVSSRLAYMRILDQVREGNYANIGNISDILDDYKSQATNTSLYATKQDYQREFYKTYNSLAEMEDLLGGTKTIDEQQLDVMKEIASQLGSKLYTTTSEGIVSTATAGISSSVSVKAESPATVFMDNLGQWFADLMSRDVPGFAGGGSFPGGYRIVGENGPELEYTGPSQITSNQKSKALIDNSELVRELKSLREDVKAYGYAIAKNTGKSSKILDRFDVDGIPEERTIT